MNPVRLISLLAAAYLAVFLESRLDWIRRFLGAEITLLPALMVYASLSAGIGTVAALAVCAGLWLDTLGGAPLGVSILPLFVPGFVILQNRELLLRESRFAQTALGLAAGVLFPLGTLFLLLNMGKPPPLGWMFPWQLLVAALSGGMLAPVCFWFFDRVQKAFEHPPLTQSSFRPDRQIKRGRL